MTKKTTEPIPSFPSTWSLKIGHISTAGSDNNSRHYKVIWPYPYVALWDPGFIKFQQELKSCPLDWRTQIYSNVVPAIFQHNHICQVCWKNTGPTFQWFVVLQFRVRGPKKMKNYSANLSPTFDKDQDLVFCIRGQL